MPVLVYVLEASLRLLHPYMPFVTEELWQNLKHHLPPEWQATESIMVATYPEADDKAIDPQAERVMESVIEIIRSIRNTRAQYKVESSRLIEAQIYSSQLASAIIPYSQAIQTLARARPVTFLDSRPEGVHGENTLVLVLKESEVVIPMESMINLEAEKKRLLKEIEQSQAEVAQLEARLRDREFLTKAPVAIVDKEQNRLTMRKDKLERLKQQLDRFA
jgi:valyl-tRNA synthetase